MLDLCFGTGKMKDEEDNNICTNGVAHCARGHLGQSCFVERGGDWTTMDIASTIRDEALRALVSATDEGQPKTSVCRTLENTHGHPRRAIKEHAAVYPEPEETEEVVREATNPKDLVEIESVVVGEQQAEPTRCHLPHRRLEYQQSELRH